MLPKFKTYYFDFIAIGSFLLLTPFFFYKLGQSSLVSWDEAWYAEIARNILKSGDIFNLTWNGMPYFDHPPTGFWLIAFSEFVFGQSEFGVRVASAIAGFLAVVITYFLGKNLFNRTVGWCSGLGLVSAFWFLFRARSGNLDVFLTFFFLLTFLTAWKARTDKKWLIPFMVSCGLLILTKTGIPFTIVPSLVIILWGSQYRLKELLWTMIGIGFIVGIWLASQYLTNNSFMDRYIQIGLPGVGVKTSYFDNFNLAKTYLHDGIGKWFWLGILGLGGSFIIGIIELIQNKKGEWRMWMIFPLFFGFFFGPFILTSKGHIWHLIPLHPVMILSFFGVAYWIGERILRYLDTTILRKLLSPYRTIILSCLLIVFAVYISSIQLKAAWFQFVDQTKYISDEQILSTEAGKVPGRFFIDDDFGPTAVWYSGKNVMQIRDDDVKRLFHKEGQFGQVGEFVLITKQFRLNDQGIEKDAYKILKSDRDKILIVNSE